MPLWFETCDGEPPADKRLGRPLCLPGDATPATAWAIITDDTTAMRTAIGAGATGVLVPLASNLDTAGRMAVALSVIEAEQGLGEGDLALMALVTGPAAALALARSDLLPRRLMAIGADRTTLVAAASAAGAATAAGLVALAAAARGIPAFVADGPADTAIGAAWNGFALRLTASANPPNGKNRSKP